MTPYPPRCYTVADLLAMLQIPRATFYGLKKAGKIPCLEELKPRIGRRARYRADLIDRYLANEWRQPRAVSTAGRRW